MGKNEIKIMLKVFALIGAVIVGLIGVWLLPGVTFGMTSLGFGCPNGGLLFTGLIIAAAAFLMAETERAM